MIGSGCSCNGSPGIWYIAIKGSQIGVLGMQDIFEQWSKEKKTPETLTDEEILDSLRKSHNYIGAGLEPDYAAEIRRAYQCFHVD